MESLTDESGARISIAPLAKRIVSLVPSTTETLASLNIFDRVVGVTRYCVHPAEALRSKTVVGGTKSPRLAKIRSLAPDLILANLEENRREDIESLREMFRVFVSFPRDLAGAIDEIERLGILLGSKAAAPNLVGELKRKKQRLEQIAGASFRFLYLIWKNPYMAAGQPTFVDAFLSAAGGVNVVGLGASRYPEIEPSEFAALRPDVIFLSSEPFPFSESDRAELARELGTDEVPIRLVNGEYLSWHGSRLRYGIPYLEALASELTTGS